MKRPDEERAVILGRPDKRPYGTRAHLHLGTAASIGHTEGVCVLLHDGAIVTIEPRGKAPWEGGDKYSFTLEGFATAAAAEAKGRRLVLALLWTAVSMNFALRLEYATYEPTSVYDRTRSGGLAGQAYATVGWPVDRFVEEFRAAYAELEEPDPSVLLSMEIYSGARLEVSQRARFLAIVSALEPLAEQRSLGSDVDEFVDQCVARLDENPAIPDSARASLLTRLQHLRRESVRQGILRVVRAALPGVPGAVDVVDDAYEIRSELVHSGRPSDLDLDLELRGLDVSDVLRSIYASRLKRGLNAPARSG
jgi:hypothetical protein